MTSTDLSPSTGLTPRQTVILIVTGVILWFAAALLLRALEPIGAFRMPGVLVLYAALIPGTWPFILLARRLAGLRTDQTAIGITLVTAAASLCDGNALVWAPGLYGANPAGSGAAVLWGVGVGLVLGLVMNGAERGR